MSFSGASMNEFFSGAHVSAKFVYDIRAKRKSTGGTVRAMQQSGSRASDSARERSGVCSPETDAASNDPQRRRLPRGLVIVGLGLAAWVILYGLYILVQMVWQMLV